jgi:hypothetical protein
LYPAALNEDCGVTISTLFGLVTLLIAPVEVLHVPGMILVLVEGPLMVVDPRERPNDAAPPGSAIESAREAVGVTADIV